MPSEEERRDRLKEGERVVFTIGSQEVTINEIHAFQLGVIGVFAGIGYGAGLTMEAITFSMIALSLSHGIAFREGMKTGDSKTMAVLTSQREPWWFSVSYTLFFLFGSFIHNITPVF
jgi:hypothetical protein